jgi:hypothetical protein
MIFCGSLLDIGYSLNLIMTAFPVWTGKLEHAEIAEK